MKKDLVIGIVLVAVAALGIGVVVFLVNSLQDDDAPKTIKPRSEIIAALPAKIVKEEPEKPVKQLRKIPIKQSVEPEKKKDEPKVIAKVEPEKKKDEPKVVAKLEPEKKKDEPKVVAKLEVKIEPKVEEKKPVGKAPDLIELGEITKINRPDGEYTVNRLDREDRVILLGKVKLLKVQGTNASALLDASELEAQEIIFTGDIGGDSRVKLFSPQGNVTCNAEVTGSAQLEIIAPQGKVILASKTAAIVTGGAKVSILARDVELNGDVNGSGFIAVTLTAAGSLKFSKILGGGRVHYGKANAIDPEPRIQQGIINPGTEFRKIEPAKK